VNALTFTGDGYVGAELFMGGGQLFLQAYTFNVSSIDVVSSTLTNGETAEESFETSLNNVLEEADDVWYVDAPLPSLPFQGEGSVNMAVSNNGWVLLNVGGPWDFL